MGVTEFSGIITYWGYFDTVWFSGVEPAWEDYALTETQLLFQHKNS